MLFSKVGKCDSLLFRRLFVQMETRLILVPASPLACGPSSRDFLLRCMLGRLFLFLELLSGEPHWLKCRISEVLCSLYDLAKVARFELDLHRHAARNDTQHCEPRLDGAG